MLALVIGIGIFNLYQAVMGWTLSDAGAYWDAAVRLREGQPLYPPLSSVDASDVYRYAPWFAWLAVPWTYLPQWLAGVLWSAVLLGASALSLWPVVQRRAWLLVALFAPILVGISAVGNAQPLIVAALMLGLERKSGPVWVALAASLKLFPILFALVWLGRLELGKVGLALALTALLWLPAPLLYDLGAYPTDPGQAGSLFGVLPVWFLVVGLMIGGTLALSRSRFSWLAAGTTVAVSLPRIFVYDVTFLMPGALPNEPSRAPSRSTRRLARSIE
ncbi:MAG TPA: hypothetical protein VF013_05035 [Candidatus Limnocylindria bacterium]